jgi:hypothetical protein
MSETIDAPAPADTAPASPAPAAAPADDWRATLPDDLKALPQAQKYATPADLLKGYVEAEKMIGRKGVQIPGENATPEEQAAFRAALGVPDAPDAYGLKAPEGVPAEVWSDDAAKAFAAKAHEAGLTTAQAQAVAGWWAGTVAEQAKAAEDAAVAAREEATAAMKTEWGGQFNAKLDLAKRALDQFGGKAVAEIMTDTGLGNHPDVVRMFARIGEAIAEDKPAGMGGESAPVVNDPRAKAMAIINDPKSDYWNSRNPVRWNAAREEVTRLLEEAVRLGR